MSITDWDDILYKFDRVQFGKTDKSNDTMYSSESDEVDYYEEETNSNEAINVNITDLVNESKANELLNEYSSQNELNTNIEFTNKRDYRFNYGIDINTIPDGYKVKMRYNDLQQQLFQSC